MDRKNGFSLKKGGLLLLFPLVSPETLEAALLRRSSTHTKKNQEKVFKVNDKDFKIPEALQTLGTVIIF